MEGMMGTGLQQITVPPGMAPYRPRMIDQNAIQRYDTVDQNIAESFVYIFTPLYIILNSVENKTVLPFNVGLCCCLCFIVNQKRM